MNTKTQDDYQGEAYLLVPMSSKELNNKLASLLEARDQLEELKRIHFIIGETVAKQVYRLAGERDTALSQLASEKQAHRECHAGMVSELEEVESRVDDEWLNAIAKHWKQYAGKEWDTKDGECREEGLQANVSALFGEMDALKEKLTALRQRSGALYNWIQGNVTIDERARDVMNKLFDELDKGVKEGKR